VQSSACVWQSADVVEARRDCFVRWLVSIIVCVFHEGQRNRVYSTVVFSTVTCNSSVGLSSKYVASVVRLTGMLCLSTRVQEEGLFKQVFVVVSRGLCQKWNTAQR
jgi:hypothetical protein